MSKKSTYSEKLLDPRWQKLRLEVLQRDNWTCQLCGSTEKTLHVHHAIYSGVDPWETPRNWLFCACSDCHEAEHEDHRFAVNWLLSVLADIGFVTSDDLTAITENAEIEAYHVTNGKQRNEVTKVELAQCLAAAIVELAQRGNEVRRENWAIK